MEKWSDRVMNEALAGLQQPPQTAISARPPAAHAHGEGAITIGGMNVEKAITYTLLATSLLAAAVVIAPLALPSLGIGQAVETQLIDECCANITPNSGLAHQLSNFIGNIPVVGTYLNTADGNNLFAPAATMLGGYAAGSLVEHMEKEHGGKGTFGTAIRITSMAVGTILALPVLLPGIAHGALFLDRLLGANGAFVPFAQAMGTNACAVQGPPGFAEAGEKAFAAVAGEKASGALLAGHTLCFAPAIYTALAASGRVAGEHAGKVMTARKGEAKPLGTA